MRFRARFVLPALATLCAGPLPAQGGSHWVTSWATAQQLAPTTFGGPGSPPPPARRSGPEVSNLPATFADQTVRMIVHTSLGGSRLRVELSNMIGAQSVEIGAAHIALHNE